MLLTHAHALARALQTLTRTQAKDRGPDVQQLLKVLMTRVDNYIWSETKFQEWAYEKRDAQVLRRGWWSSGRGQDETECVFAHVLSVCTSALVMVATRVPVGWFA